MTSRRSQATILLAHGSRDPLWRQPIEAVAAEVRRLAPQTAVRCAYLELTAPELGASADELVALGATCITVLPLFLGLGKHAREDLPSLIDALRLKHPATVFVLKPAVGENSQVIALLAELALS